MTPELIWDYGEKMQILKEDEKFTIPEENQFGVLVSRRKTTKILEKPFQNIKRNLFPAMI